MNNELYHFGTPGMKWGVRKARDTYRSEVRSAKDKYKKAKAKARDEAKQEKAKAKANMTPEQRKAHTKKCIAIGSAAAAGTLAVAGGITLKALSKKYDYGSVGDYVSDKVGLAIVNIGLARAGYEKLSWKDVQKIRDL